MTELQVINGQRLTFLDEGAGEPLVLLHAFPLSSAMWGAQRAAFRSKHRVVLPDLPGFGGSEPITSFSSPTDRMADSVEILLDQIRIRRAVVGGCSMGGYVALALAKRYPRVVRGLVLTNTRACADGEEGKQKREQTARAIAARGMIEVEESLGPKLLTGSAPAAMREEVLAMLRAAPPKGAAAASRGMAKREDTRPWLKTCPVPVLVLHGEEDAVIARAESEELARLAPQAELVVLPNAAHLAPIEQAEAWNAAVAAWLARLPR